jgi:hypothetical protein
MVLSLFVLFFVSKSTSLLAQFDLPLSTKGSRIVDQSGSDFIVKGVNWWGINGSHIPYSQEHSKGTNTHRTLPANYADYLLVIGSRGAAMIDRVQLEQWIDIKGDSITAQIPTHCMDFVFTPQTISGPTNNTEINLRRDITETLFRAIQQMQ